MSIDMLLSSNQSAKHLISIFFSCKDYQLSLQYLSKEFDVIAEMRSNTRHKCNICLIYHI